MDEKPITVTEFVDTYYKPDRLKSEPGRRERLIADKENDLRVHGNTLISRHDSVTGEAVVLYNPCWRPKAYLCWCVSQ